MSVSDIGSASFEMAVISSSRSCFFIIDAADDCFLWKPPNFLGAAELSVSRGALSFCYELSRGL